jgi:hypothetical protein
MTVNDVWLDVRDDVVEDFSLEGYGDVWVLVVVNFITVVETAIFCKVEVRIGKLAVVVPPVVIRQGG